MLRTKQLYNLSGGARYFILGGSRCSAADGSSCTCSSEDEACLRKQETKCRFLRPSKSSAASLVPKTSLKVGSSNLQDAVKLLHSDKEDENAGMPFRVSSSATGGLEADNGMLSSSPPLPDQLGKAGMATAGLLSDLLSHKPCAADASDPNRPQMVHAASLNPNGKKGPSTTVRRASGTCGVSDGPLDSHLRTHPTSTPEQGRAGARGRTNCWKNGIPVAEGRNSKKPCGWKCSASGQVVENVVRMLRRLEWGPAAEAALASLGGPVNAYYGNQVLKRLPDHEVALGFFHWLKRQPGFQHDGHTYTTMIGILGRSREFAAADKLLQEMVRDGCHPNVVTYNRLIHSYGSANFLGEAVGVFEQMRKAGCEPDRVTYCTLIDIHAKAGYLDVAMAMYRRMQASGLSPDTFTYSVIINCLGKAGHLAAAQKLFCEMVGQGCAPSLVTYNIMIAILAKARNYRSALGQYRSMQHAGFRPDKVTYSIVMEVLGQCGQLDEAEGVFREMTEQKWVPDEPVYGLLVDLWGKAGNVEKAWEWYQTMIRAGLHPNVPTCNSLLGTLLRVRQLEEAHALIRTMLGSGLRPSLQTYTLLLSCCTEARSPGDMGSICDLMAFTGHPAHSFLLGMPSSGLGGRNLRDHVSDFFDRMHCEDRESKRGLADAMVDFFYKAGLKEEASSVWEVASRKNVYPGALRQKGSFYWLINLHVMSDGTAVTALSRTLAWFRRQLLISGTSPSRIDIVTGWGRRSRVTGSSLVRHAVQELLQAFRSPFFADDGNSGCFVGSGESLRCWLLQSHVDRMHLL